MCYRILKKQDNSIAVARRKRKKAHWGLELFEQASRNDKNRVKQNIIYPMF